MPKIKTFSRREQLLRLMIPLIVFILVGTFLFWLGWKIIQGIVYLWNLIEWNSIKEWFNLHFFSWWTLVVILGIVTILYLVRQIPRISKSKAGTPKPNTSSSVKSGPRWDTVLWFVIVVGAVYFLKGYFINLGRNARIHHTEISFSAPTITTTEDMMDHYGTYRFKKGVPYHYIRGSKDEYFYPTVCGTTIWLQFIDCNHPESHWEYRVTRRLDGTIQTGDDERLHDHDQQNYGKHSVTLLSDGDVSVEYSDRQVAKK